MVNYDNRIPVPGEKLMSTKYAFTVHPLTLNSGVSTTFESPADAEDGFCWHMCSSSPCQFEGRIRVIVTWELRPIAKPETNFKMKGIFWSVVGPWRDYYEGCRVPKSLDFWCVELKGIEPMRFNLSWNGDGIASDVPLSAIVNALNQNPMMPADSVDPIAMQWTVWVSPKGVLYALHEEVKEVRIPAAILHEVIPFTRTRYPDMLSEDQAEAVRTGNVAAQETKDCL